MLEWLKKKAIAKSKSNIETVLNNLAFVCAKLEVEMANTGQPVNSGPTYDLLIQQRQELLFQLNGPMTPAELRAYVEPFLAHPGAPRTLRLAVEATIDQYASTAPEWK